MAKAKAKKFETIEQENAYYNELVTVKLFKDNDKYKDDVFVAKIHSGLQIVSSS